MAGRGCWEEQAQSLTILPITLSRIGIFSGPSPIRHDGRLLAVVLRPPSPPFVHTFPWHPSLPPLTFRASPCCPDPLLRPPGQSVYEPWPPSRWPYRDKCALYVKCWDGDNGLRPFFVPPRLPPSKPHRPTCVTASMRAGRRTSSSAISAIPPPPPPPSEPPPYIT